MSGLVGWVDFRRDLRTQEDVLHAMTETMRARGPDAKGVWVSPGCAIGHRRLDTGGVGGTGGTRGIGGTGGLAHGEQPAVLETGAGPVVLGFAGEIYNLDELRRAVEGQRVSLRTGSDTEILLQGFLLWGAGLAERLNGMFAFAIWDARTRRLLLGRDRLGLKPLYYVEYPGALLFASEPKGIIANPLFEPRLDFSAVPILLQPRLALAGETPLVGLREVAPGQVVEYGASGLSSRLYWRLASAPHDEPFEATARHVRELMEDIVARQVPATGACGAMLSGGVDSTSVAALATRALRRRNPDAALDTFCIRFDSDPAHFVATELRPEVDAPYAAAAAGLIGSRHRTVTATVQELMDAVPATRRARDLPGWGQFDASMYLLFRQMRGACTVALTGEAADEFFGGYPYFFKPELVSRDHFPWLGDGPKLSDYLAPDLAASVRPDEDERARYAQLISQVPRLPGEEPGNARMREVLFLAMSGPLAVILDRQERMSMALGLQVRFPFCDHRLVEYVWNVPWSMKCTGGLKGLLKAAMADILPPSTLNRQKSAYPHVQSPRYDESLVREATWIVNDAHSPVAWMFDAPRLNELLRQVSAGSVSSSLPGGVSGAHLLIQLVELRRWVDEYRVSFAAR